MMKILHHPDPRLRIKAVAVDPAIISSSSFQALIDDMLATMYEAKGVGLAATQVDVHRRLLVMDVSPSRDCPWVMVNPIVVDQSGSRVFREGCLSVPGAGSEVRRADIATVEFLDRFGVLHRLVADGILATCVQHEIDHLDGVLFLDRISSLRRDRALRQAAGNLRGA